MSNPVAGQRIHGWGRNPVVMAKQAVSEDLAAITRGMPLTRGLGRSYGDASLPRALDGRVACTILGDRILSFDEETGLLHAEAGLALYEIYRLFLLRGWFLPTTPGTKFVTLGGAVASDVHGKNHHVAGCFGAHVELLRMRLADDRIVTCSRTQNADLFLATVGGMGLTGHILEVAFNMVRIPSPWIYQETTRIEGIDDYYPALKEASANWPFTVGWIDCLANGKAMGRGILYKGRWAEPSEAPKHAPKLGRPLFRFPIDLPSFAMGPLVNRTMAALLFHKHPKGTRRGITTGDSFWYPLDILHDWNRAYGKMGFTQYQCVLPDETAATGARHVLEVATKRGAATFLCVIKDCGKESDAYLSFLRPGVSIAIDIPMRSWTGELVAELNRVVIAHGGRIYLTKDTLTTKADFEAMEPRLAQWKEVRRKWDPEGKLRSTLSERLFGDGL